jgi:tRNA 2-thiouridine synthesizing protein A
LKEPATRGHSLDVKGTCCPYPQLKTKVTLDKMNPGEILEVLTDDRTTADNICLAVKQLGDIVLDVKEREREFVVSIERSVRGHISALKMDLAK